MSIISLSHSKLMQGRIREGATNPGEVDENLLFSKISAENCMKMKEIGQEGERLPSAPLDPPMKLKKFKLIVEYDVPDDSPTF